MKFLVLLCICVLAAAEECKPRTDSCGLIVLNSDFAHNISLYSGPNFKGEHEVVSITGPYGCTNDIPNFKIKSLLSTGSTQVTLHYGKDCVGHVHKQYQGGSDSIDGPADCPGSIFVKYHRYGSC